MRFLHTSDWHLGRRLLSVDLLAHQDDFLQWLLGLAQDVEAQAVVVSGDVYDRAVPSAEAVTALDRAVAAFAASNVPLLMISGNHDSPVRLRYGSALFAHAGVHVRADVGGIDVPVIIRDDAGEVGFYGIPYLEPDAVREELGTGRSHEEVLQAAVDRIRADASARGLDRTVVAAHAFITGGEITDSERDISVGGVGDAPAGVFDGVSYVALGHLHRPQTVRLPNSSTMLAYSGSPLGFSFSERDHTKSVALVELDAGGAAHVERIPTPVPRPLRQVQGRLGELIARADSDLADLTDAWVKVVLTDPDRPESPMERLRQVWPHTIALDFAPEVELVSSDDDMEVLKHVTDPVEITARFVEYVTGSAPDTPTEELVRDVVEELSRRGREL